MIAAGDFITDKRKNTDKPLKIRSTKPPMPNFSPFHAFFKFYGGHPTLSCLTAGKWKITLNEQDVKLTNYSGNLIRGYNLIGLDISTANLPETSAFVIQVSDLSDSSLTECVIVLHKPTF